MIYAARRGFGSTIFKIIQTMGNIDVCKILILRLYVLNDWIDWIDWIKIRQTDRNPSTCSLSPQTQGRGTLTVRLVGGAAPPCTYE